mgnify:CR=1 FL=1
MIYYLLSSKQCTCNSNDKRVPMSNAAGFSSSVIVICLIIWSIQELGYLRSVGNSFKGQFQKVCYGKNKKMHYCLQNFD